MPSAPCSLYPPPRPPNSRILVKVSPSSTSSKGEHILVSLSSLFIVGSVFWAPLLYTWAWQRWRAVPKSDKRRRALYASLLLSLAALATVGPHRAERIGNWLKVRKWSLWKVWLNFIAFEVVADDSDCATSAPSGDGTICNRKDWSAFDVLSDRVIFAMIPHGIFPFALAFAALPEAAAQAFGQFRPVVATATSLFPFVSTFLGWLRAVDASPSVVNKALSEGSRIGVAPGGIAEMFEGYPKPLTHPNDEYAILASRKGFIRLAIKHGIPVVPVYCFGATKMMRRLQLPAFFEHISKLLRISFCIFYGSLGLPIPFRQRLWYVMGRPIFPPEIQANSDVRVEASDEFERQVNIMHGRFCDELLKLFDRHKESYGWGQKNLRLV